MSTAPPASSLRIFNGSFLGLIAWLVGFVMTGIGGHELLTALRCGKTPAPVTVAELAHRGPTTNDYVALREFEIQWSGYVYCQNERGEWASCDVPLRVAGSEAPPRVLVRAYNVRNEDELRKRLAGEALTGIVTARGLYGAFGAALSAYNPGIDPAACWIVTHNRQPADARLLGLVFGGGVALFSLGIFLFVYARPRNSPHQAVLRMMSPLLILVEGLHALADFLPPGSRRICGALLLPPTAALATWGGYRLWQVAQIGAAEAGMGAEILAILALDFGVSLALVAISFLLIEPKSENAEVAVVSPASAGMSA